ncbi:hypothetical protein BH11ACT2_BH11ACT2_08840 [soil metagenome]
MHPQRVLITQRALFTIAGSEVVTFELARHFSQVGAEVVVVTYGASQYWSEQFAALPGVRLHRFDAPDIEAILERADFDLAWIHHQLIPSHILRNPGATAFVFHHMSAFEPQEFPIWYEIEAALANSVVFPAAETLEAQVASGLLDNVETSRLGIFGNPAPDEFFDQIGTPRGTGRLLVVSNHAPTELIEALTAVSDTFTAQFFGEREDGESRIAIVAPEDLDAADAVISIGKTVQYSLVRGIPVYCYDHFGGPGWLNPANFEKSRERNFSGRGFAKKTADQIATELREGLEQAQVDAIKLHEVWASEFLLSNAIGRLLGNIVSRDRGDSAIVSREALAAFEIQQRINNGLVNAIAARDAALEYERGVSAVRLARTNQFEDELNVSTAANHELVDQNSTLISEAAVLRSSLDVAESRLARRTESIKKLKGRVAHAQARIERLEKMVSSQPKIFLRVTNSRIYRRLRRTQS